MLDKSHKHNFDRQSYGIANAAFEKPRILSTEPPKPGDDFIGFDEVDTYSSYGKVGISIYTEKSNRSTFGRIAFSVSAAKILNLTAQKFAKFVYSPSKKEWAFTIHDSHVEGSLPIRSSRKSRPTSKYGKSPTFQISKAALALLISQSTDLNTTLAFHVPFSGIPDEKGRYFLITRLAKITSHAKDKA